MSAEAAGSGGAIRAGVVVLTGTEILVSAEVRFRGGLIAGWEHVPESSLSAAERSTILTPGLVNAHTHLDLGALRGAVSGAAGFLPWVQALVAAREELSSDAVAAGVQASAAEALRTGTTTLIDIDSMGVTAEGLSRGGHVVPRAVLLREVLDGSPQGRSARTESALIQAQEAMDVGHGLSPHATHTVGDDLMEDLARLANRGTSRPRVPVGVHWAETSEETQWLIAGSGPFAAWLGPSPGVPGTVRLQRAGLLEGALLIHGNDPQPGEPERIAAAGGTVVHCPGCHLFFGRGTFPMERYAAAGVRIALGTDSWASNAALDMRREMRLARATLGLDARSVWQMATEHGARCVPDPLVTGTIAAGAAADLVAFTHPSAAASDSLAALAASALEALTQAEPDVQRVWVGGRPAVAH